jgi:ferredoxin, 2Fe-2S
MYAITVYFEQNGIEPVTLMNVEGGQTLLEIALQNDIELHHNCGGVCSCTTCNLYIEKGMEFIDDISKREKDYLERVAGRRPDSRLGCQSLLTDGAGEIEVRLPDQSQIPDEYYE